MEETEGERHVPDDVKQKRLHQAFHRVQQLRKQKAAEPALVKMTNPGGGGGELPPPPERILELPTPTPHKRLPLSGDEERDANELLSYIAQHRERLGLAENFGILQKGKRNRGGGEIVRGSHVRLNVEHLIYKGSTPPAGSKPPGHATFLQAARKDPVLSARLQLGRGVAHRPGNNKLALALKKKYRSRRDALVDHLLKGGKKKKKRKTTISQSFAFKPVLWK